MIQNSDSIAPVCPARKSRARVFTPEEEEQIRATYAYDPATGVFTWRKNAGKRGCIKAGTLAGWVGDNGIGDKRMMLILNGKQIKAHRIAFFLMTGRFADVLDHADGNPMNNKFENLREASVSQNSQNKRAKSGTVTGLKGVSYIWKPGAKKRFKSLIVFEGKQHILGTFLTAIEAHECYCSAAFFAFGEFANIGY